jgi:hypothetical protein
MEMKMKKYAAHTSKGRVATHKNSFAKHTKTNRITDYEAIWRISKVLAGIDPSDLTQAERQILDIVNLIR